MPDNRPPDDRYDDQNNSRRKAYDFDNDEEWDVEKYLAQRQQRAAEREHAPEPQEPQKYEQEPEQQPQGYRRPARRTEPVRQQPPRRVPRQEETYYENEDGEATRREQGYRRPANRQTQKRKKNGNGKLYAILAIIAVLILVLVIWLISTIAGSGKPEESTPPASSSEPSETEPPTEAPEVRAAALVQEADVLAAGYDYDAAVAKLEEFGSDWQQQPTLAEAQLRYNTAKQAAVRWSDTTTIPHVFFHTLIADTARAFDDDYTNAGYNQYMTTIKEFAKQVTDENGNLVFEQGDIYLPEGKKPIVMSQDDVNYYEYMVDGDEDHKPDAQGDGFADHIIVGEDGYPTCTYVDANGQQLTGDYDLVPILEKFCQKHPDFSYRGARAIIALTGYQGVFGYRTNPRWIEEGILTQEQLESERAEVKKVAQCLREKGWEIASHSWGHINFTNASAAKVAEDTQKWEDQIETYVGETDIFIYPHGADIAGIGKYSGEKYETLYNAGFRYFCNVDGSTEYWVQIWNDYVRQGRRNLDGYRMYYNPELLDDLFDVKDVWDDSRPTPVPPI